MIRGVELVNFMSYEHAYVPVAPGLNIVVGPNGAGKSSILLGISLVLGQSHTERGKRLVDLIRWGQDEARVTLTMDNRDGQGEKLFPDARGDSLRLTRVLSKRGEYGWLLGDQPIHRKDVLAAMDRLGIHTDNMFIIMHQLMVHKFASVSGPEKLRMLEEAVGFHTYRDDVKDALARMQKAGEEERALNAVLESTRETYDYWSREYEKYRHKTKLEQRLRALEAELAWAKVQQKELAVRKLEERLGALKAELGGLDERLALTGREVEEHEERRAAVTSERGQSEEKRLEAAKEFAAARAEVALANDFLGKVPEAAARELEARRRDAEGRVRGAGDRFSLLNERLAALDREFGDVLVHVIEGRVEAEVLAFRKKLIADEVVRLDREAVSAREDLDGLRKEASLLGPRVEPRKVAEVHAEANAAREDLKPLAHLSAEVERMYETYARSFDELRGQASRLVENRRAIEDDVKKRVGKWKDVVNELLDQVNGTFNELIQEAGGTGYAKLVGTDDFDKAGLDIRVGYRGQEPIGLDTFAQSGGERSAALMAFLLALQRRIASPFRAVDEFDVHLDPRNRELVTRMIVANGSSLSTQYVAITPGPVAPPAGVNVIVVQSVAGVARVGLVTR